MDIQRLNPSDLWEPAMFTQVVTVRGGCTVFVSGQVAYDTQKQLVGKGDLAAQAREAFRNLKRALAAGGATPQGVVKVNIYVVHYRESDLAAVEAGLDEGFGSYRGFASTLIGVASLAREGLLIEVEAIAAVE